MDKSSVERPPRFNEPLAKDFLQLLGTSAYRAAFLKLRK
jgi:hypothetical protein